MMHWLMNIHIGTTDSAFPSLFCHSWHGCAVLSESRFLVHGGYNGNDALSDTFIFNTGEHGVTLAVTFHSSLQPFGGFS